MSIEPACDSQVTAEGNLSDSAEGGGSAQVRRTGGGGPGRVERRRRRRIQDQVQVPGQLRRAADGEKSFLRLAQRFRRIEVSLRSI
jgi:hypothetical protein